MNEKPSDDLRPLLEQAAKNLIQERILSKGGKQPSPQAVEMVAKMIANKGIREGKLAPPPLQSPITDAVNVATKTPLPKPLRQPSPQAVEILAKMVVHKGIREGKLKLLPKKA